MGSKGSQISTSQSTATTSADPQAAALYRSILSQAQQAAQTPYQAYQGQQVAGFTPDQLQAMQTVAGAQGSYQPALATAMQYGTQAGQAITPSQIQAAMSPYTQNVVQSTMDVMNQQNQQAMSQLRGTEAQQGAFGGTRAAVAESNLAAQQERSKDQIVAGLMQQGYSNAVAQAQADRAAAGTGAGLMSGLAGQSANLPLSQAQAELGTGALQQQLAQQQLNVPYQQFLQAQAYPYQQLSWLAGLGTGVGSQLGGTSTSGGTTTTTPAQPSLLSQIAGGALAIGSIPLTGGASAPTVAGKFMSMFTADGGRVPHKADGGAVGGGLDVVGTMAKALQLADAAPMADGGAPPIPAFVQQPQMQEPGSDIIQGALKMASAMRQGAKALGGGVSHMADGGVPGATLGTADIQGRKVFTIFPQTAVHAGKGAPSAPGFVAGSAPKQQDMSETIKGLGSMFKGAGQTIGQPAGQPLSLAPPNPTPAAPAVGPYTGTEGGTGGGLGGRYAYGGAIHKEGGGLAGDADGPIFEMPADQVPTEKQMADWRGGVDFGKAADQDVAMAGQGVPMPRPRPIGAYEPLQEQPDFGLATAYAPTGPSIATAPAVQAAQQVAQPAGVGPRPETMAKAERATSIFEKLTGMELTPEARQGLMAMGLRMMTTPGSFGTAIGAGGMQGMATYAEAQKQLQERAAQKAKLEQEERMATARLKQAETLHMTMTPYQKEMLNRENLKFVGTNDEGFPVYTDTRTGKEVIGSTKLQQKAPPGYVRNPDGTMSAIKGGPADPEIIRGVAQAKAGSSMNDQTADFLAERVINGDKAALTGIGRGAQGAENIIKIQSIIAQKAADRGLSPTDILAKTAEQFGLNAQQRTFGTQVAKMAVNATEAEGAIKQALDVSNLVPRTSFVPINKLIQLADANISDPNLLKFKAANLAVINTYARAISPTGTPTVHDKEEAEKIVSSATSPEAYRAIMDQMLTEIAIAHSAPMKAKQELERIRKSPAAPEEGHREVPSGGKSAEKTNTAPPAVAAPAASAVTTVKNPPPPGAVGTKKDMQGNLWYFDAKGNYIGRVQ